MPTNLGDPTWREDVRMVDGEPVYRLVIEWPVLPGPASRRIRSALAGPDGAPGG